MQQKMIQFSGDVSLPAIGQGTWYMGEDASQRKTEVPKKWEIATEIMTQEATGSW